jgi:adenosylhomocysteine nucleosidase
MSENKRIAIIGAMEEEIAQLLARMEGKQTVRKAGMDFFIGSLFERDAVVCRSGVGKVNAAVCTQLIIDTFHAQTVIFTGVAGALHPELNIGDIVISTDCVHHDMDATALGFPRGTIPFQETSVFPADSRLIALAYESARKLSGLTVLKGRILSGDQFVADRETVNRLYRELGGACTEMEGAAVAQVCCMNEIPFVIVRSMSDRADGTAPQNFAEFVRQAAARSVKIVEHMLRGL